MTLTDSSGGFTTVPEEAAASKAIPGSAGSDAIPASGSETNPASVGSNVTFTVPQLPRMHVTFKVTLKKPFCVTLTFAVG